MGYFTTPKTYSFLQGLSWELLLCSNQLPNLRVCRNQTKCLLSSPSYQPIKTSNKTCVQALQPCHPAVLPRNLCQVAPAAFKIPSCSNKLPAALLPTAQLWLLPTIVLPSCCPSKKSLPSSCIKSHSRSCCLTNTLACCLTSSLPIPNLSAAAAAYKNPLHAAAPR